MAEGAVGLPVRTIGASTAPGNQSAAAQAAANVTTDLLAAILVELRVSNYLRHLDMSLGRGDLDQIRQQETNQL
jgi:hypothetical protein